MMNTSLRINSERLQADFDALALIGATGDGGVHRPALWDAHLQARRWFRGRILEAGLEFRTDGAGNHSALLRCGPEGAPSLLLGSHLDSVPYGGRFDGALGVLAALEVVRTVQEAGLSLPFHLEAIDFTDEEGTLVGLLGSSALGGRLAAEDLQNPRGGREVLLEGLERAGLSVAGLLQAGRDPAALAGYIEVHIEQGPRLVEAGADIGVVSAITGIGSYRLAFFGRADHAGTTPMENRLDASQGASAFTLRVRQIVLARFPDCVANVGSMRFEPGAFNIIPARAELALEYRSGDPQAFDRLEAALLEAAQEEAGRYGLGLEIEVLGKHQPTPMSPEIQEAIGSSAGRLGLQHMPLSSGAGHDAQSLAGLCPVGMFFVPSFDGASHSAREFTDWQDCVNGANVLLGAVLNLASG
jgi:beta-ureidopropionase / N-carbamoyl-L-amino-acid hydrolase